MSFGNSSDALGKNSELCNISYNESNFQGNPGPNFFSHTQNQSLPNSDLYNRVSLGRPTMQPGPGHESNPSSVPSLDTNLVYTTYIDLGQRTEDTLWNSSNECYNHGSLGVHPQNASSYHLPQYPSAVESHFQETQTTTESYPDSSKFGHISEFNPTEATPERSNDSSASQSHFSNRNAVEFNRENVSNFYKTVNKTESDQISSRLSVTQNPENYSKVRMQQAIQQKNLKSNYKDFTIFDFVEVTDVETAVETISNGWIRLNVMKKIAPFNNEFVECIDSLGSQFHIAGWKKSRGDGNCYYRAVITRYLEIISNPYSEISNLRKFILMIENLQLFLSDKSGMDGEYVKALEYIFQCCKQLEENKKEPNGAFLTLMYWFQVPEFDINLVRVARLLTYQALIQNASNYMDFGIDINTITSLILSMGEEAEAFVLMLLPLQLGIKVIQYNLFKKVNIESFPNQDDKVIEVHIVRRGGHYDILYTKQELERDMYRLSTGTYFFYNQ